eukprot:8468275-Pyramimonas_sp.AAC.1
MAAALMRVFGLDVFDNVVRSLLGGPGLDVCVDDQELSFAGLAGKVVSVTISGATSLDEAVG